MMRPPALGNHGGQAAEYHRNSIPSGVSHLISDSCAIVASECSIRLKAGLVNIHTMPFARHLSRHRIGIVRSGECHSLQVGERRENLERTENAKSECKRNHFVGCGARHSGERARGRRDLSAHDRNRRDHRSDFLVENLSLARLAFEKSRFENAQVHRSGASPLLNTILERKIQ